MPRHNLYAIDINREKNCYSYRGFKNLARNYINQEIIEQERRIEYRDNCSARNNLNKKEGLIVLN